MPNGKGTIECWECGNYSAKREPNELHEPTLFCSKWDVLIPRHRYRTLNLICSDFESSKYPKYSRKFGCSQMIKGMLYAVFYNDISNFDKWEAVYNLQTKLFVDGKAKEVEPVVYNGVKYTAPHFKYVKKSTIWEMHDQNGGFVEARDGTTDELLWDVIVYETRYDSYEPMDTQDVFITSLTIEDDNLIVTNEKNEKYLVNVNTRNIEKV